MMRALLALLGSVSLASGQDPKSQPVPWVNSQDAQASAMDFKPSWNGSVSAPAPASSPWMGSAAVKSEVRPATIPLELDWSWSRLRADLEIIGRVRAGLEREVRGFQRRRSRLVVKDLRTGELLPERQDEAISSWRRVLDQLLALDSIVQRYGKFEELHDPERRTGAFVAAFSAYAASARFAREWVDAASDPSFVKPLDLPLADMGLKPGSFSSLLRASRSPPRNQAVSDALLYGFSGAPSGPSAELKMEGSSGLLKTGSVAAFALSGIKDDTRRTTRRKRVRAVPVPNFEPWMRPVTAVGVWTGEATRRKPAAVAEEGPRVGSAAWNQPAAPGSSPFSSPWLSVDYATGTVEGIEEESTLHYIVRRLVERSTATRPSALVSEEQLATLNERLEPGDILLLRRENWIDEPGLGGWWTGAAIYIGTPQERDQWAGSHALDTQINAAAPDAYWESLKADGGRQRRLILAAPGGVRTASLERGAAADSVAVLRPRLPWEARSRAALRAFQAVGRPHDAAFDVSDPAALYSAELILWAYGETPLSLEPRSAAAAGPSSPSDFARTFDGQFGTSKVSMDVVRFLDGQETRLRAVRHEPEQFRLSWRRPRWRFEDTAGTKDDEYQELGSAAPGPALAPDPIPDTAPEKNSQALER